MWADPEYREKMTKKAREQWEDPEFRERLSGENSSGWKGGISKLPYSFDFNDELKQRIKERDECKCVLCGDLENLRVHHINYDKMDSHPVNLITLCWTCHGHTNHDREIWEEILVTLLTLKIDRKIILNVS